MAVCWTPAPAQAAAPPHRSSRCFMDSISWRRSQSALSGETWMVRRRGKARASSPATAAVAALQGWTDRSSLRRHVATARVEVIGRNRFPGVPALEPGREAPRSAAGPAAAGGPRRTADPGRPSRRRPALPVRRRHDHYSLSSNQLTSPSRGKIASKARRPPRSRHITVASVFVCEERAPTVSREPCLGIAAKPSATEQAERSARALRRTSRPSSHTTPTPPPRWPPTPCQQNSTARAAGSLLSVHASARRELACGCGRPPPPR